MHNSDQLPWQTRYSIRLLFIAVSFWALSAGAEQETQPLEQKAIVIKGGEGLPKTLYIAPWKRVGEPLESNALEGEIGEETEPLERDLFQRELELQREGYSTEPLSPVSASPGSTAGSGTTD